MTKSRIRAFCAAVFIFCISASTHSLADKFFEDNDAFFLKYLKQQKFEIDSSASAVVLYEYNSYDLHSSENYMRHEVRRIIKIIKKSGTGYADINIPLRISRFTFFHVNKVHGTTYNLEDGKLVTQEIDGDNISLEKSNLIKEKKISMPVVREGSIIDYSFETEEPNYPINIAGWEIQEDIPKLYSRTEIYISNRVLFKTDNIISRFKELDNSKKSTIDSLLPDSYFYKEVIGEDLLKQYWVRKNIPAFSDEPYLSNENDCREHMNIRLTGVHTLGDQGIMDTWNKINEALVESYYFYRSFPESNASVKQKAKDLAGEDTSELTIAKKIYRFVRDSIAPTDYESIFTYKDIPSVLEEKNGSPAEINFLLIGLLRHAGLSCSPLILATKDKPRPNPLEPDLGRYDYTICQLRINGEKYYLDASEKYNPFGRIPPYCLNGYARVIDKNKKDTCGIVLKPEMSKEKALYSVTTTNNALNDYTLNYKFYFSDAISIDKRTDWNKDTTEIKKYILSLIKDLPLDAKLRQHKVLNLNDPEKQLTLDFTVSLTWPDAGPVYLNPYAVKLFESDPFKNPKRKYPVELPATENLTYSINLKLPDGYTVDEVPKSAVIQIDENNQYKNLVAYDKEANTLSIQSRLQTQRVFFPVSEYDMPRTFFQKMGDEQQHTVVIKKQN